MAKVIREFRTEDLHAALTQLENAAYGEGVADCNESMKGKATAIKQEKVAYQKIADLLNISF